MAETSPRSPLSLARAPRPTGFKFRGGGDNFSRSVLTLTSFDGVVYTDGKMLPPPLKLPSHYRTVGGGALASGASGLMCGVRRGVNE
jgi:hypothetical protein